MTDVVAGIDALEPAVARWLDSFRRASNDVDLDTLWDCFAEVFVTGDASGSQPVPRETFLTVLPNRVRATVYLNHEGLPRTLGT